MEKKPADYLHINDQPTLCGLDWSTLYFIYKKDVKSIDLLRAECETEPYRLCPNCDAAFSREANACLGCKTPGQPHQTDCTKWEGWVTWTTHNRRDYTVRGRTREEAYAALKREAEKFAPEPLIQNLHPVMGGEFVEGRNAEEQPVIRGTGDAVPPGVPEEFATWGPPGLRPHQRQAFQDMHRHEKELIVPPMPTGFGGYERSPAERNASSDFGNATRRTRFIPQPLAYAVLRRVPHGNA